MSSSTNLNDLLLTKVHDPHSKDFYQWKKNVTKLGAVIDKKFLVQTNSQFPVFSCNHSEEVEVGKTMSRIRVLEVSLSLIANAFYVNEYLNNINIVNSKAYLSRSIQIVHTETHQSDEVKNIIEEMKKCYPYYTVYNHHFLCLQQEGYYPINVDDEDIRLYHLLFGKKPEYSISLIYGL